MAKTLGQPPSPLRKTAQRTRRVEKGEEDRAACSGELEPGPGEPAALERFCKRRYGKTGPRGQEMVVVVVEVVRLLELEARETLVGSECSDRSSRSVFPLFKVLCMVSSFYLSLMFEAVVVVFVFFRSFFLAHEKICILYFMGMGQFIISEGF